MLVIGIGAGNPDHVTMQAVAALNEASVFFVVDKGDDKGGLLAVREEICRRFIRDQSGYRIVEIPEPPRDRGAAAYAAAVADWHEARAVLFEQAIARHLPGDGIGAFLVWGDPALYDSTLRIIDRILARGAVTFEYDVIPGITAIQALTAAYRLPLNRIGEPIHVTTGRRLAAGLPDGLDSAVVMLDAGFAAAGLDEPDLEVFWGAYLSTPDEVLVSGRLGDVGAEIERTKQELKAKHGWIMDSYLLRRLRS
ncbi:MAG: precorrin-6A synthase [Pseudonocardiales bacterium]|nr:precorrin-6A synthase [Pseudonocardiales bacterium]